MPGEAVILYHANIPDSLKDTLQGKEGFFKAALERNLHFGIAQWRAEEDSGGELVGVLRHPRNYDQILTYVLSSEVPGLSQEEIESHIFSKRRSFPSELRPRSMHFDEMSAQSRASFAAEHQDATIHIPRSAAKIRDFSSLLKSSYMPTHTELSQPMPH